MKTGLAFVLGGGGARGALQIGALRALLEAGYRPDLLVGTSIGAANATGLALWGVDLAGVAALERSFHEVAEAGIISPRLANMALRAISGRPDQRASRMTAAFFIERGITPELLFGQITAVRLALIGADLDSGQPIIYGENPEDSVLEGLLASMALPPWFAPFEKDGHTIMDGGIVSNLPIEPALRLGATSIIALDLDDPRPFLATNSAAAQYLQKLVHAVKQRQSYMESRLASAMGVPLRRIRLLGPEVTPLWDLSNHTSLIEVGYGVARQAIIGWRQEPETPAD